MPSNWTGVIAIEGQPTGDGRMLENGALWWENLPIPLIWDRQEGDHSAMVVGTVTNIFRDETTGNIHAEGTLSESEDAETRAAVMRVSELLEEGAVGVSIGLDSETVELRADPDLLPEGGLIAAQDGDFVHFDDIVHFVITPEDQPEEITAAIGGDASLPVAPRDHVWSGAAARNRVFDLASREDGTVDETVMRRAFLFQDPDEDPNTKGAWKLGVADVIGGKLTLVPRAVAATAGGRGVGAVSGLSDSEKSRLQSRVCRLYDRIRETHSDWSDCPFSVEMTTLVRVSHDDSLNVVTSGRVRHLAIVDTPAIADARIALVASVAVATDATLFVNPNYGQSHHVDPRLRPQTPERPGEAVTYGAPLTVDEDTGRVTGHAALWGRCHAGFRNRCVVPPRGAEYSRFLHGEAVAGLPTGPLTVGTTHAKLEADAVEAFEHYAHTGRAVADVTVGEDHLGLWVSGQLRPNISERDLADLRGSSLSGDWRPVNGRYRLTGLLAVNQPGYLVQRATPYGGVITAGPCACDEADPYTLLAARVEVLESVAASLLATGV